MKMEFKDINTFLHNHVGEKWFDIDLKLYKSIFPNSKLLVELERAQKYNKVQLDERMCSELMTHAVCDCSIWENRGYTKDKDGFIVPMKSDVQGPDSANQLLAIDQLLATNLDEKQKYNTLKALVIGLGLPTKDKKEATYIVALKDKQALLLSEGATIPEATNVSDVPEATNVPDAVVKAPKAQPKKKAGPREEYPQIDWTNLKDREIQLCHLLYEDRVYAYEKMVSMDAVLDSANDGEVIQFIDADSNNHLAFLELSYYEKHKTFLYLHPLLTRYKLEADLNELRVNNPEEFMNQSINASKSITRYQSLINNKKYKDKEEMESWLALIREYNDKLSIIKSLISK